jgi:hypothetical protein
MCAARPRICFHQMKDFVPHCLKTVERNCDRSRLHSAEKFASPMQEVMEYFDEVAFDRAGTLMGDYAVTNAPVLIRRDGMLIKFGAPVEDYWAGQAIDDQCMTPTLRAFIEDVQAKWDSLPFVEHEPVLYHPYHSNYYHWSLEAIPSQRMFGAWQNNHILVPSVCLERQFQKNLLARTARGNTVFPILSGAIVRNPILACGSMSEESVWWLRRHVGIVTTSGRRRIYLRRSTKGTRAGGSGGVSESEEFLDFLAQNGFETVDFSDRELRIDEQVNMLDGAAVILAPHGAALTNLAYLSPPLSVIEVIGSMTPRAFFMHISAMCGFDHHAVFSSVFDENRNIVVDVNDLRDALAHCDPPRQ